MNKPTTTPKSHLNVKISIADDGRFVVSEWSPPQYFKTIAGAHKYIELMLELDGIIARVNSLMKPAATSTEIAERTERASRRASLEQEISALLVEHGNVPTIPVLKLPRKKTKKDPNREMEDR